MVEGSDAPMQRLKSCCILSEIMKTVQVQCAYCFATVVKAQKEATRSVKRGRKFFCNNSCSAFYFNAQHGHGFSDKEGNCGFCEKTFISKRVHGKYITFCSRSCASAGSVNDSRREAARKVALGSDGNFSKNWGNIAGLMKKRETWRYVDLEEALGAELHEFECEFGGFLYDLFLPHRRVVVEFDGTYHTGPKQKRIDHIKDLVAKLFGYNVIRIKTEGNGVIPSSVLQSIEYECQRLVAA